MTNSDPHSQQATADDFSSPESVPVETLSGSAGDELSDAASAELEPSIPQPVSNEVLAGLITDSLTATQTFSARADFYENQVRQLQQRIDILQADQIQQLLGPVFQRLAILLTQAADSAGRARSDQGRYQAEVEFDYFHDLVLETLDLMNANSVEAVSGVAFDRTVHAARKTAPTSDESLDGTVAKVLRQGIIRHGAGRAFIPAQVSVYRYSAASAAKSSAPPAPLAESSDAAEQNTQPGREGDQS
jgi:molecular chaperone GrpE (heat shock protein)